MFIISSLFSLVIFFVLALCSVIVSGAPVTVRDVYVPPVIYPNNYTVWKAGGSYNVTWDTTNPPRQITNKRGLIVLSKAGRLQLDRPLALNFDILTGRQEVTVPKNIKPGKDYSIVLFGDSGNSGEQFTITTA